MSALNITLVETTSAAVVSQSVGFCSGHGQHHTANPDAKHPKPYTALSMANIMQMMADPKPVPKEKGQWVIFSDDTGEHGRNAEHLRSTGALFYALWGDIDEAQGVTAQDVLNRTAFGATKAETHVYTSRSATEENQKCRIIVPLAEPVDAITFEIMQEVLNNRLAAEGLKPDRVTQTCNQLCYLPNRGAFYWSDSLDFMDGYDTLHPDRWAKEVAAIVAERKAEEDARQARMVVSAARYAELVATQGATPIQACNEAYGDPRDLWLQYGGKAIGRRVISPNSSTGSAGVTFKDNKWFSSHGSDVSPGLGQVSKDGRSCWGDSFDLVCFFEFENNRRKAVKEMAEKFQPEANHERQKKHAKAKDAAAVDAMFTPEIDAAAAHLDITGEVIQASKTAERIAAKGAETLKEQLGLTESADELIKTLGIDPVVIDRFISETVRNSTNSGELLILTKAEHLNNHRKNESWPYLLRTYGAPYNNKAVEKLILDKLATCDEGEKELTKAAIDKLLKDLGNPVFTPIMQHIEYHNQRGAVSFQVDMFAHERSVRLRDRDAAYTLTHRPLVSSDHEPLAQYDAAIVADYKDHFPELDEVLDFLTMARFAPDRKKAYLWLHCPSDWGKGFFKSALKIIGATAELNVKEVEAFFEGKPVGRDPHEFTRTLCLVFDEFKSVKSELKQIENTITVTPKFKMASEVEVFAKLFLSAETVGSLIGESGIEDQMANRFSCILGTGNLEVRPMFVEVGKHEYMRHVVRYMLEQLNTTIEQCRNLGRADAAKQADRALSAFHQKHGIDKLAPRLSEALEGIANEFLSDIYAEHKQIDNGMGLLRGLYTNSSQLYRNAAGDLCLRQAHKTIGDWIKNTRDYSEQRTLSFKRPEILKLISKDGSGKAITVRNPARYGETGKAVVLRSLHTDYAAYRDGEDAHEFDI